MSDDLMAMLLDAAGGNDTHVAYLAAARVRELEAELAESRKWHEGAREVARLLTERAERAEAIIADWKVRDEQYEKVVAERNALRALLRTCPYEVNKPQSIADAQWVRDVRAALGERHE